MSVETKPIFSEFVSFLKSLILPKTILLDRFRYIHVQDKRTGVITLYEGPMQVRLHSQQVLLDDLREKIRLSEGQYVVVVNPYNSQTRDIVEGERETRLGPLIFALYPGELLEADSDGKLIRHEYSLTSSEALLLYAERPSPHPVHVSEQLTAGAEYLLKGTCRYIPHKDIRIKEKRESISLAESEGVYLQNDDTGEVRLVLGPKDFFLEHNQSLWDKQLLQEELIALGYARQQSSEKDVRVLSTEPKRRDKLSDAVVVSLENHEAIYLYDDERVRVVFGPETVFLEANERPRVLFLSGGVPVRPNILRIAKLHLGPDFFRDQLFVRTRDNATLLLDIAYRWRFQLDAEHPERLFALKDFIGFVAQTLSAEIREESARHDFETFHAQAGKLVTQAVFADADARVFTENGMVIFGVDVERIAPQDDQISARLATAILNNVEIMTETARKKAHQTREQELIEGNITTEEKRKRLIELEQENALNSSLAEAQRKAETILLAARSEAEAYRLREQAHSDIELSHTQRLIALLETSGGKHYIQLEQARILNKTDKLIVPTDARIYLDTHSNDKLKTADED